MNRQRIWGSASGCTKVNETIKYYNQHAGEYYKSTINVDFNQLHRKFVSLLPENARIIDIGCGSGRDVKAFCDLGYQAIGLDASEELANEAMRHLEIEVVVGDMATWVAQEPFDGIWCCAALLHLREEEANSFFHNLQYNLKPGGILFLSVKEGIETGPDEKERYMRNYTKQELSEKLENAGLESIAIEKTADRLGRDDFHWLNALAKMIIEKE